MWTTDVLREEHRWILRMLQCLERVALQAEREARLDAACAAELLALFTHFADGLHQEREERYLFPRLLARARDVAERVAIGRLCGEHEEERRSLTRMNQALLGAVYGQTPSLLDFQREARRYVELHRAHVLHENQVLLPHAEALLTAEDDEQVMRGFVALEREGPQHLKQVFERVRALCARLGIDTHAA
ncbi:MAG TPA: hemerythrin domain-containing protein [Planctomycetota bacterium]